MADSVTPEYLLKGAVYSLEQCEMLLRDAALLYKNEAYASAVALAAFAREALGQWIILLNLRKEVISSKGFTVAQIKERCGDHVEKQRAGMRSVTLRADRDTGVGRLITSKITAPPGTEEAEETEAELAQVDPRMKRAVPTQRHEQRTWALYVDPIAPLSVDRWNRPSIAITSTFAQNFVNDARNDFSGQLENRYNNLEILRDLDAELCKALEQWSDRPTISISEVPVL